MIRLADESPATHIGAEIASIEEIIEEARCGRAFILVDAPDRENEGDVIIPAQFASAQQIAFMARHACGLICLAMTSRQVKQLDLQPMTAENRSGHGTAFTVSIEAKEGITTGISASDRARTIGIAIDPNAKSEDLVSPGHVFPLMARDGGVLVRAGHTEAGVDICRLANLAPAAVICEVMNPDGSMARLPDLQLFAKQHGLKIGAISDLIAYKRQRERIVVLEGERDFSSAYGGQFRLFSYRSTVDGSEHTALVKGEIGNDTVPLVRMHRVDIAADMLAEVGERRHSIARSLAAISDYEGPGIAVFIQDPSAKSILNEALRLDRGSDRLRNYGIGAQILIDLGVREMILLRGGSSRPAALDGYDLKVRRSVSLKEIGRTQH